VISPLSVATGISHPLLYRQGLAEIRSTRPLTAGLPPMLAVFRIWGDALASNAQLEGAVRQFPGRAVRLRGRCGTRARSETWAGSTSHTPSG